VFALQYATAILWRSWGVRPDLVLGEGPGEYAAAAVSGWLSLEDAVGLVVGCAPASQAPSRSAGGVPADGTAVGIAAPVRPRRSGTRFVSCTARDEPADADPVAPEHWVRPPVPPRRLPAALREVAEAATAVVEIGPPGHLVAHLRTAVASAGDTTDRPEVMVTSLRRGRDLRHMLTALAALWAVGVSTDWPGLWTGDRPGRMPLPGYPYERSRYWVEPGTTADVKAW
jgi:acyl transferase domain-containing protein